MPTNNNTQTTLVQCAICPARLSCPWNQFSNDVRKKYCPVIALIPIIETKEDPRADLHKDLEVFLQERLN